jgi:uncharacterized protein (TIGR02996 family)
MPARNEEIEREILKAPDDPAAYLVYADWLQGQGDPRGELIVRQREDRDADPFLAEHRELFLGRFATATPETFQLEWRFGFIRKATIGWELFGGEHETDTSAAQLEAFLRLDSARLVEELWLGPTAHEDQLLLDELAPPIEAVQPIALRTLYLGDTSDWDISSTSTRMPRSATIAQLRRLLLRGGSVTLDEQIELPELVQFSVETGSLTAPELAAIANARWPALEELEIWFGDPNYGATGGVSDIAPILAGRGLDRLRVLRLKNCPFADELAEALIGSPILTKVHTLDLSMGNLSDRAITAMLARKDAFAHLQQLDVSDNALTDASWPAARDLAKQVTFGTEHDLDRIDTSRRYRRYVSVGE